MSGSSRIGGLILRSGSTNQSPLVREAAEEMTNGILSEADHRERNLCAA
jgi:hypothetical protein